MVESPEAEATESVAVVVAYLFLILAAVFHALVLLPDYRLPSLHTRLVWAVTVLVVLWAVWRIAARVRAATDLVDEFPD